MESLSDGFKALKRRGFGHTTESTIFISSKPAMTFCSQANLFISFQLFLTDLSPKNACTPIFHSVKINSKKKTQFWDKAWRFRAKPDKPRKHNNLADLREQRNQRTLNCRGSSEEERERIEERKVDCNEADFSLLFWGQRERDKGRVGWLFIMIHTNDDRERTS